MIVSKITQAPYGTLPTVPENRLQSSSSTGPCKQLQPFPKGPRYCYGEYFPKS